MKKCKTKDCKRKVEKGYKYCSLECAAYDGEFSIRLIKKPLKINPPKEKGPYFRRWRLWGLLEDALNKFPMTGKVDKYAGYKNGWYDCAYHIRCEMKGK